MFYSSFGEFVCNMLLQSHSYPNCFGVFWCHLVGILHRDSINKLSFDTTWCHTPPYISKRKHNTVKADTEKRFTCRLPAALVDEINEYLEKTGMPLIEFIRRASREKLDRDKEGSENIYITKDQVREIIREELRNYERVEEEK